MNLQSLLDRLEGLGAHLKLVGDHLRVVGPTGAITPDIRAALVEHKIDIVRTLREPGRRRPARVIPDPAPPELWGGEPFELDADAVAAFARFAASGTQPAWDDLIGACLLERQRTWCEETLDAVYRGQLTLWLHPSGRVVASRRGALS